MTPTEHILIGMGIAVLMGLVAWLIILECKWRSKIGDRLWDAQHVAHNAKFDAARAHEKVNQLYIDTKADSK